MFCASRECDLFVAAEIKDHRGSPIPVQNAAIVRKSDDGVRAPF
jgi:hypothetical protein